jgi:hypothetical protein
MHEREAERDAVKPSSMAREVAADLKIPAMEVHEAFLNQELRRTNIALRRKTKLCLALTAAMAALTVSTLMDHKTDTPGTTSASSEAPEPEKPNETQTMIAAREKAIQDWARKALGEPSLWPLKSIDVDGAHIKAGQDGKAISISDSTQYGKVCRIFITAEATVELEDGESRVVPQMFRLEVYDTQTKNERNYDDDGSHHIFRKGIDTADNRAYFSNIDEIFEAELSAFMRQHSIGF